MFKTDIFFVYYDISYITNLLCKGGFKRVRP